MARVKTLNDVQFAARVGKLGKGGATNPEVYAKLAEETGMKPSSVQSRLSKMRRDYGADLEYYRNGTVPEDADGDYSPTFPEEITEQIVKAVNSPKDARGGGGRRAAEPSKDDMAELAELFG